MSHTTSADLEQLEMQLREYLATSRPGDAERMAQRLTQKHSVGSHVIGLRRSGREAILHRARTSDIANVLALHRVTREGRLPRRATIWKDRNLELWIDRHHHYLDWVNPVFRTD